VHLVAPSGVRARFKRDRIWQNNIAAALPDRDNAAV
jgi:hypothetical protein